MRRGVYTLVWSGLIILIGMSVLLPRLNPKPDPYADGLGYFCYLPALASSRPFDLEELAKPEASSQLRVFPATGRTVNLWGIGTALGWLPFYEAAHLFSSPDTPHDDPRLWRVCAYATIVFMLVGLVFVYLMLRVVVPDWIAFVSSMACLLCTPLLVYASITPYRCHAFTFMLLSLLLWMLMTKRTTRLLHWVLIGVIIGLLADARSQLVFCALLPLVLGRPNWRQTAIVGATALIVFFPQMLMWKMTFGVWLANPQGMVKSDFWHVPAVWQVLFSPKHGLFLWHPLLLVSTIGLIFAIRKSEFRSLAVVSLTILISQVILNSAAHDWWGGWAFGGRRFCDLTPLFVVGLAYLLSFARLTLLPVMLTAWWNVAMVRAWVEFDPITGRHILPHDSPLTFTVFKEIYQRLF